MLVQIREGFRLKEHSQMIYIYLLPIRLADLEYEIFEFKTCLFSVKPNS